MIDVSSTFGETGNKNTEQKNPHPVSGSEKGCTQQRHQNGTELAIHFPHASGVLFRAAIEHRTGTNRWDFRCECA
jgi:hypothetical protein